MGNNGYTTVSGAKDILATRLVCNFNGGYDGAIVIQGRQVQDLLMTAGNAMGYAMVAMPMGTFSKDEACPSVAFKLTGPAGLIKPLSRASIGYSEGAGFIQLMAGTVINYTHTIATGDQIEDSVVCTVADDRYLLSRITCTGKVFYDPISKVKYYDAGEPLIFNRFGYADALDCPDGKVRFAPSQRYGFGATNQNGDTERYVEPSFGAATQTARSWTVEDVCNYLRDQFVSDVSDVINNTTMNNQRLCSWVGWPSQMAYIIGKDRSVKEFDIQNWPLDQALQALGRKAGAYDIIIKPGAAYYSEMSYAQMNPSVNSTTVFNLPDASGSTDVGVLMGSANTIQCGYINESVGDYFHQTVAIGDPYTVERLASTVEDKYGEPVLEPAWSQADETNFKAYIHTNGDNKFAFDSAAKIWPYVYAAWRVTSGAQIFQGCNSPSQTTSAQHPRFRPVLLTGQQVDDANPKDWDSREIVVETLNGLTASEGGSTDPMNDGNWTPVQKFDGLALTPDSRIVFIPWLRDAAPIGAASWTVLPPANNGNYYGPDMRALDIRLTAVSIEADFCISSKSTTDINQTAGRLSGDCGQFTWTTKAGPLEYVYWLRKNSYPVGVAKTDATYATSFGDRCTAGSELFSDQARLDFHAEARQEDVCQIEYSGSLTIKKLVPSIYPGLCVSIVTIGGIRVVAVVKTVRWDGVGGTTTLDLNKFDRHDDYNTAHVMSFPQVSVGSGTKTPTPDPIYTEHEKANIASAESHRHADKSYATAERSGNLSAKEKAHAADTYRPHNERPTQHGPSTDRGDEGPTGGAGADGAAGSRGHIYSGDEVGARQDAQRNQSSTDAGIFSQNETSAADDELRARHGGQNSIRGHGVGEAAPRGQSLERSNSIDTGNTPQENRAVNTQVHNSTDVAGIFKKEIQEKLDAEIAGVKRYHDRALTGPEGGHHVEGDSQALPRFNKSTGNKSQAEESWLHNQAEKAGI